MAHLPEKMAFLTVFVILAALAIGAPEVSARRRSCFFTQQMKSCAGFGQQNQGSSFLQSSASNGGGFRPMGGSNADRIAAAREFVASVYRSRRGGSGMLQASSAGLFQNAEGNDVMFAAQNNNATCAKFNSAEPDPAQQRHASFLAPTRRTHRRSHLARGLQCITEELTSQCGLSYAEVVSTFGKSNIVGGGKNGGSNGSLGVDCSLWGEEDDPVTCNGMTEQRIRTINGTCNNLQHPIWGSVETIYERLIDPVYDDGLGELRTRSPSGNPLPLGRMVSTCISPLVDIRHPVMTQAGALFGQFITHDLVLTPTAKIGDEENGRPQKPPKCCGVPPECLHEDCFPIPIPPNDESFSRIGQTCMEFVRSVPALEDTCNLRHREQLNQQTHFLDLSDVYGATPSNAEKLRRNQDGLLLVNDAKAPTSMGSGSNELLPPNNDTGTCKKSENGGRPCFLAGDQRVNTQPLLIAYQTVFFRSHNMLARGLKMLAGQQGIAVNDEALFQTARKILIAMYENIVFNEFLPVVLGNSVVNDASRQVSLCGKGVGSPSYCTPDGFYTGYKDSITPQIMQSFSTAAFRLHTIVPNDLMFRDHVEHLGDVFFNPQKFYESDAVSSALDGGSKAPCQFYDQKLVRSLRDELFRKPTDKGGLGLDLLTLNTYRGRDHGLPGYTVFREFCQQGRARTWDDLRSTMSTEAINALRCAYKNVDEIDLYVGCISETPQGDGVVGPTASCLITEQFFRTRAGDRFWFENPGQFNGAQLREIRKTMLSSLICLTTDIKQIQPLAMLLPQQSREPNVACADLLAIDLKVFLPILQEFVSLTGGGQTQRNFVNRPAFTTFNRQTSRPFRTSTTNFFPTRTISPQTYSPSTRFPSSYYTSRSVQPAYRFYKSGQFSPFESKRTTNLYGRSVSPSRSFSTTSFYPSPYYSRGHFQQIIAPRTTQSFHPPTPSFSARYSQPNYWSARPATSSYSMPSYPTRRTVYAGSSSFFPSSSSSSSYSSAGSNLGSSWAYAGNLVGGSHRFARALPSNWIVQSGAPYATYWYPPLVGRAYYAY